MVYSFLRCKFEYLYVKNTTRSAILKVMFLFKCKCGMDFEEKKYESTFIYPKKAQLKKNWCIKILFFCQIVQVAEYEARNSTQSTIGNYLVSGVYPYQCYILQCHDSFS